MSLRKQRAPHWTVIACFWMGVLIASCQSVGSLNSNNSNESSNANRRTNNNNQGEVPNVPKRQVSWEFVKDKLAATVSERFLSFAVDTAQVVGGVFWDPSGKKTSMVGSFKLKPYDFSRARLRRMVMALRPAFLRIGGSAADETFYDLSEKPVSQPPEHYKWILTKKMWDGVHQFVTSLGLRLVFTLNAGKGPRNKEKRWTPDNARTLLQYVRQKGTPVESWELGNEVNGYRLILNLSIDETIYSEDVRAAKALLKQEGVQAKLAGPASAYWPIIGEFGEFYTKFMKVGGKHLDLITWHYYPQQSRRCPTAVRRAAPEVLMKPENLAEIEKWMDVIHKEAKAHAPHAPIWLGETGNAQCGGEPEVSDTFVGGFWWLDQLARVARRGQSVVVRQNLSGSNYGLIQELTLSPNPDYWNSVLWKRLMGSKVLWVKTSSPDKKLLGYAHCSAPQAGGKAGAVTVLLLNLHPTEAARANFPGIQGPILTYLVTSPSLQSKILKLNGRELKINEDGSLPEIEANQASQNESALVDLPPKSYLFAVFPNANFRVCQ